MKKLKKTKKSPKTFGDFVDLAVAVLVVGFVFVLAFSAIMVSYFENKEPPVTTPATQNNNQGSSEYPTLYAKEVKAAAEKYGLGYDLIAGANIAGFEKVADAMLAQGIM